MARPNPGVAAIIVKDGRVIGRGWTRAGGRPHAEAVALEQAGAAAKGATLYVTLEPCAHVSQRGASCADLVAGSGLARVVIGMADRDERTAGQGAARLQHAGIAVFQADVSAEALGLSGHAMATTLRRPAITLKLALSLDGCIALASGESQWITGPNARAHAHRERARHDAIVVGGGTLRADNPSLDVRLPGLENRSPDRFVLTSGEVPDGWGKLASPDDLSPLGDTRYLFIEGGASTAAAFLSRDLVDRLLIYRAPILLGGGRPSLGGIGLSSLAASHGRWARTDFRVLGSDMLEVYSRTR